LVFDIYEAQALEMITVKSWTNFYV